MFALLALPLRLGRRQFCAAVDPGDFFGRFGRNYRTGVAIGIRDVDDVDEIILALRIVVADAAQQVEHVGATRGHHSRIAQPAGAFLVACILELDHLLDPSVGIGDDAAVMARFVGFETQHHDLGRVLGVEPIEHGLHRLALHEGDIAVKDEHIARVPGKAFFRLLHRVTGAQLRFLQAGIGTPAERLLQLVAPRAHHHNLPGRLQGVYRGEQVVEHGSPGDRMQHLVRPALHAGALARGKDDGGEFA